MRALLPHHYVFPEPTTHSSDIDGMVDNLKIMHMQERAYQARDYFKEFKNTNVVVGEDDRYKMAQWFYDVVDVLKIKRETVSIAMSFVDRFVATPLGRESLANYDAYQLACMTSLYIAIKINEVTVLNPTQLATIGDTGADDIENMEQQILKALEWRMQPPTMAAYGHLFMNILSEDVHFKYQSDRQRMINLAFYQTELACMKYGFISDHPSVIAYAAFYNALILTGIKTIPQNFDRVVSEACSLDEKETKRARLLLLDLLLHNDSLLGMEYRIGARIASHFEEIHFKETKLGGRRQDSDDGQDSESTCSNSSNKSVGSSIQSKIRWISSTVSSIPMVESIFSHHH